MTFIFVMIALVHEQARNHYLALPLLESETNISNGTAKRLVVELGPFSSHSPMSDLIFPLLSSKTVLRPNLRLVIDVIPRDLNFRIIRHYF